MKKNLFLFIFILSSLCAFCQNTHKVTVSYTLYASEDMSIESAKHKALERAKIDAIEQTFGTVVSQINMTSIDIESGNSKTTFSSHGGTEIRGEWIETLSEPIFDISCSDNLVVVTVTVTGVVREISSQQNNIEIKILRNGVDSKCESSDFFDGDEMFMSFVSSSKGYLVVYLLDAKNNAYRLLPYRKQQEPSVVINDNEHKIFFSKNHEDISLHKIIDEYILTTSQLVEINTIYVVFSHNNIYKAIDYQVDKDLPRELRSVDFHKWLADARRKDNQLIVKEIPITIKSRK